MKLFDNYDFKIRETLETETREDYPEWSEEEVSDYVNDIYEENWDCKRSSLCDYFDRKGTLLIMGTLGLWDGRHAAGKIWKEKFDKAISEMLSDCDYWKVEVDDGDLVFTGWHHDGCNSFTVRELSPEGEELYEEWNYDFDDTTPEQAVHEWLWENESYRTGADYLQHLTDL